MALSTLRVVFEHNKEEILQEIIAHIKRFPWSPYQQFLVHTEEGRRRLRIFVDLFGRAMKGEGEIFFKDQERVGYARAMMEGFGPEILSQFYSMVPEIFWSTLRRKLEEGGIDTPPLCNEVQVLNNIFLQGYTNIMGSYLRVREERISEKVNQLQELQRFTHEIITLFELEELVPFILKRMTDLFGVPEGFFSVFQNGRIREIFSHPADREAPEIDDLMERARREGQPLFMTEDGDVRAEMGQGGPKRIVSAPVQAHGRVYGVICFRNFGEGFQFPGREFEFLNQFLYIMAAALENALMLKEVEQAREALSLLTGKMITIQEEERRRLAADIHDTLTQTLIGISYKIQFCRELPERSPEMLADQLDNLLGTVNQAIDQSRNLISSLRPDLIDTMGLIPALERHVESFSRETGIRVSVRFPKKLQLSSEVNICLFRVAQEALMNVYKHAETDSAELHLRTEKENILFRVSDRGKGFVASPAPPFSRDRNRLGLLSMRERIESIGGKIVIDTGTDQGCSILVTIPYSKG